jgi:hypothetical protein
MGFIGQKTSQQEQQQQQINGLGLDGSMTTPFQKQILAFEEALANLLLDFISGNFTT